MSQVRTEQWIADAADEIANESLKAGENHPRSKYGWIGIDSIKSIIARFHDRTGDPFTKDESDAFARSVDEFVAATDPTDRRIAAETKRWTKDNCGAGFVTYFHRWDDEAKVYVLYIPLLDRYTQAADIEGIVPAIKALVSALDRVLVPRWDFGKALHEHFAAPSSLDTAPEMMQERVLTPSSRNHNAPTPVQPAGARELAHRFALRVQAYISACRGTDRMTGALADLNRDAEGVLKSLAAASVPVQPVTEQEAREWLKAHVRDQIIRVPAAGQTALQWETVASMLAAFANRTAPAANEER